MPPKLQERQSPWTIAKAQMNVLCHHHKRLNHKQKKNQVILNENSARGWHLCKWSQSEEVVGICVEQQHNAQFHRNLHSIEEVAWWLNIVSGTRICESKNFLCKKAMPRCFQNYVSEIAAKSFQEGTCWKCFQRW